MIEKRITDSESHSKGSYVSIGHKVLQAEAKALTATAKNLGRNFHDAVDCILECKGRLVVIGVGKSGHIGRKISATLASTGTPSFFVHAGEASHGDVGMIVEHDIVLALSNSGETQELVVLIPVLKRLGIQLIAFTGDNSSTLANSADIHVFTGADEEACPLGLAPTSSTTVTLAVGDALAVTLLESRGFTEKDFAMVHPGGSLGRRLLLTVEDVMHSGVDMPTISLDSSISEGLREISRCGLGLVVVMSNSGDVLGIFTDGDLRRMIEIGLDVRTTKLDAGMTRECETLSYNALAAEALKLMQEKKINALPIIGKNKKLIGVINMHDLLRAKVF
ncbi:MAG: KpsF/GutQ family sugar-phosphate isomerase [Gammaproteobacteria bacterium]|jgi:arabinose-5-phosphate isomerase